MVKTNKITLTFYEYHCISKWDKNILFTLSVLSLEYLIYKVWGQIFVYLTYVLLKQKYTNIYPHALF